MWSWVKSGVYSCKRLELWAKPPPIKLLCTYLMENLGGVGWMSPSYAFWTIEEKAILFASYWSCTKVKFLVQWTASFIIIPRGQETTLQCLQPERQRRILRISRVSWLIFSLQYFKVQYKLLMASVSNLQAQTVIQQITLDLFITKQLDARTTTCFSLTRTKF